MKLASGLSLAEDLIFSGHLQESEGLLTKLTCDTPASVRHHGHLLGKIAYSRCEYEVATRIFEEHLRNYGDHVLMSADLLLSYYMQEQHFKWTTGLDGLIATLAKKKDLILPEHWVRASLSCGKLLEEAGRNAEAYDIYKVCVSVRNVPEIWQEKALIQIVRLGAMFFGDAQLLPAYNRLSTLQKPQGQIFHDHERLHALLMAEMVLLTQKDFLMSFERFIGTYENISKDILRWFLLDLLEMHLFKRLSLPDAIRLRLEALDGLSDYENAILKISINQKSLSNDEINHLNLAPFSRVKLWYLTQGHDVESERKFQLWLKGISSRDQTLFLSALNRSTGPASNLVISLLPDFQVQIGTEILEYARKKLSWAMLEHFEQKREWSESELIRNLWQEEVTMYSQDRLRVGINRMNQDLKRLNSGRKVINYRDGKVVLLPQVEITCK